MLAIAAVVDVALYARPTPVAAKSLAARHHLPPRHLETLLQGLVQANILKGVRGPRGGYELARERRKITVGEIVRTALALSAADPFERLATAFWPISTRSPSKTFAPRRSPRESWRMTKSAAISRSDILPT
jgi:Iron-dependent Transcriptional regulator